MRFRPDENSWSHVQPNPCSKLPKKVIAAHEIRTPGERALESRRIKADALSADSCGKLQLPTLAERWCIYGIHVIEKRTERQLPLVKVLAGAESRVKTDSQVVIEKKVQAKSRIRSAANGLQGISALWASHCGNAGR